MTTPGGGEPTEVELDTDGVPRGQSVLDALLQMLDVAELTPDVYRGLSPKSRLQRVFGGQVAAQALVAAGRTVGADRTVHSLHSYFVRPGDPREPIDYYVDRTRDGRSFTTRRVVAQQQGTPIFTLSASFQIDEPGVDHQLEMPEVAGPDLLPSYPERLAGSRHPGPWAKIPRPVDIRYVTDPPWARALGLPLPGAHTQVWFRADGRMPEDPLLHICLLTYVSDLFLLDSVLAIHGLDPQQRNLQMASLDHAVWFHRPIRMDDWVLYDVSSPSASGGRGLGFGHFFGADGQMVATVVQEGLVRLR
ncbi:acyl-CoA thioesterase [Nakamurella lactea]|uniref:acyl-CoA thioesterase n=1 Tax=Nakamurella lactea TaxID=459515 RepID=UPI0004093D7E|nr:acyl-CoA thioesterase II [Nakamurella lactea]